MTVPDEPTPGDDAAIVDWHAVFRGALLGLLVLVAASVVEAILDRNIDTFRDSGWIYPLFVGDPVRVRARRLAGGTAGTRCRAHQRHSSPASARSRCGSRCAS